MKKSSSRCILSKLLKTTDKENILTAAREGEKHIMQRETKIKV